MSKVYQVHEFAELAGVTVKALHHYDRLGLLKARRSQAGYRLYSDHDLERLEQIIALKFLGLPLKQIMVVLNQVALALPDALRLQRKVLEDKQQLLVRAINAIREAESAIAPGKPADPAILKKLMEVIGMQDDIDVMKQYYSEQAWLKCRSRYEHRPSQQWQELYREVKEALGEDPASATVQALAKRWINLAERDSDSDPEVQAGAIKAWADRQNWPDSLRRRISEYDLESIAPFIASAIAAYRKRYFDEQAWAKMSARTAEESERLSGEWPALWLEVRAALGDDPASDCAQRLAARWMELSARSSGGDSQVRDGFIRAWADRGNWPEMVQRHYASFQLEQIAEFIAKAIAHRLRGKK